MIDREATERMEDADAHIRELEAQCAAMREALELAARALEDSSVPCRDDAKHDRCEVCYAANACRDALSGDAGRALMERVEALERVAEEVRASIVRPESALGEAMAALDALETKR